MSAPQRRQIPGPDYLVAGRYRLETKIGGGGMGAVWLARDQLLNREVAVKQVVSTEGMSVATAAEIRDRAMHEGRIAARLNHRNAIAMHDVALDSGEPWLVMEYLPSRSIAAILHITKTLPTEQAAQIGAQIAAAMTEAHAAGIIHRDIKPGNILVATGARDAGLVKITDFGISRSKDDVSLAQTSVITGTPAFFAPEVARGSVPTEASDVYSLGATVYTMVEGMPPFGIDEDTMALLHRVARGAINPPTRSGSLTSTLMSMLEPSPAKRPTMAQACDALAETAAGPGGSPSIILTSPITKPGGGVPIWARRGGQGDRLLSDRPRTGDSDMVHAADVRASNPVSSRLGTPPPYTPPTPVIARSPNSPSSVVAATILFAVIVAVAAIILMIAF